MDDCVLCGMTESQKQIQGLFYEDDKILVLLDVDDVVKGHTLVIWKVHKLNLTDLSFDEAQHFSEILYFSEKVLLKVLNLERSILLKSGDFVSHFHMHIYPVQNDIPWDKIKAAIEKRIQYRYKAGEKQKLVDQFKEAFDQLTKKAFSHVKRPH